MAGTAYQFGPFRLEADARLLLREGTRVAITPKVFDTLMFLVVNGGRTVSREELIQAVWPDTFVEEGNLNYNISQIRKTLGDQEYVQTIPKVGYRFVASVQQLNPSPARSWVVLRSAYWAMGTAAIAIASFLLWRAPRPAESGLGQIADISRLTSIPLERQPPSLSSNGEQVAFSWKAEGEANRGIYLLQMGAAGPVRVSHENANDDDPVWSPDGRQIAFVRQYDTQHGSIVLIPSLGGNERKLYSGSFPVLQYPMSHPMLAWMPDGKSIVFARTEETGADGIALLSLETGESRLLIPRSRQSGFDSSPAISSDKKWLAFTRYTAMLNGQLMVQRMGPGFTASGEPFAVPRAGESPQSPNWSPDSKYLVFNDERRVLAWYPGNDPRTLYALNGRFSGMSVAWLASRARAVAAGLSSNTLIWKLPLGSRTHAATGPATPWTGSTLGEMHPRFSPDGRRITFVRTVPRDEIWVAEADGSHRRSLTHLNAYIAGFARWSPDGGKIVFQARVPDIAQIYVIDVDSGIPRRLTNSTFDLMAPSWSSDEKSIYATGPDSDPRVFRIDPKTGSSEPLFEGRFPVETSDGKLLLYSKAAKFGIFARALEGKLENNTERQLVADYTPLTGGFFPSSDGLYYTGFSAAGVPTALRFYDYGLAKSRDIAPLPRNVGIGLTVSPDHRELLYVAGEQTSGYDLLMLEFQLTGYRR